MDNGSSEVIQLLIKSKADPKTKDEEGNNSLHYLCQTSSVSTEKLKIFSSFMDFNETNQNGNTPFHLLCANDKMDSKILVEIFEFVRGVDFLNIKNKEGKSTKNYSNNKK